MKVAARSTSMPGHPKRSTTEAQKFAHDIAAGNPDVSVPGTAAIRVDFLRTIVKWIQHKSMATRLASVPTNRCPSPVSTRDLIRRGCQKSTTRRFDQG